MPTINIDPFAGFCPGVKKAIDTVDDLLEAPGQVYSLGELVHNPEEISRLEERGLKVLNIEDVGKIHDSRVLIRAHGVTPEIHHKLSISSNDVYDATCNIVHRLQQKIKLSSRQMLEQDGQVVIFGKKKHPEVQGLLGYCNSKVVVSEKPDEISDIEFTKPISIFAQTTANVAGFESFVNNIYEGVKKSGMGPENIQVYNTICGPMKLRVPNLKNFAREHDVIIFVAGKESSNGAYLASICSEENNKTYTVSAEGQLDESWFLNADKIGITGGNSTPVWLLNKIASEVKSFINH